MSAMCAWGGPKLPTLVHSAATVFKQIMDKAWGPCVQGGP